MSIQHVAAVLGLGTEVAGARRLVLIALANHADADGFCYPSRATIAREAGLERPRTVTDHCTWLEERGYISRDVNGWAGMRGQIPRQLRPNLYRLTLDQGSPDNASDSGAGVSESDKGGVSDPDKGGVSESDNQNHQGNHHGEPPSQSQRETQDAPDPGQPRDDGEQIAAEAVARIRVTGPPSLAEIGYIRKATARGWTAADILERADTAAESANPRGYLLACLQDLANRAPTQPADVDPGQRRPKPPSADMVSPPKEPPLPPEAGWDTPEVTKAGLAAARAALGRGDTR